MKTRADVARLMDEVFVRCQATRDAGQKEYAHDDANALANFERLAADLQLALHDRGLGEQYAEELWLTLAPSLALRTAANEYARLWSMMRAPLSQRAAAALSVLQSAVVTKERS